MSDSPIRGLVGQMLRPLSRTPGILDTSEAYLDLFDGAARHGAEALAASGVGLDHVAGERVLASMFVGDTPKGFEHRLAGAITDRRIVVGGYSSTKGAFNKDRWSVELHAIQRVEHKKSLLKNAVILHTAQGNQELTFAEATEQLGPLLQAIATQVPPEQRREPPTPFVDPTDEDPSGAEGAASRLWFEDPPARQMLERVYHATASGQMDATVAADLVRRVVFAHRSRASGPGMIEGTWVSPMSAKDLGHTLIRIYGQPIEHSQPQPDVDVLDFRIDPKRDYLGAAMKGAGMAVGLAINPTRAIGRAIGHAMIKKSPVTALRVVFTDRPGHARYRLQARGAALEHANAKMAHGIHQALIYASYAVLDRRTQHGWQTDYAQLMA